MEGHHHHRHHPQQQQHHQQQPISVNVDVDRFPQWSIQETKEFLMIRAELDRSFMETKRNKQLWEVISTRMGEKGYNRSAEQCKCKWKNLVTRYKGCETMEAEAMRQQFPFYNELQAIFSARIQIWSEGEGGTTGSKKKAVQLSLDEEEDMEENEIDKASIRKKKKGKTSADGNAMETSVRGKGKRKAVERDGMEADHGSIGKRKDDDG
ncbi:hypothetical protein CRYUN_Cryun16bG0140200 [Craigia yunnanensis]